MLKLHRFRICMLNFHHLRFLHIKTIIFWVTQSSSCCLGQISLFKYFLSKHYFIKKKVLTLDYKSQEKTIALWIENSEYLFHCEIYYFKEWLACQISVRKMITYWDVELNITYSKKSVEFPEIFWELLKPNNRSYGWKMCSMSHWEFSGFFMSNKFWFIFD